MQLEILKFIFIFVASWSSCWGQVAYDPNSIAGWNALSQYDAYILSPSDIVLDMPNSQGLPVHFRTPKFLVPARENKINLTGFNDLKISGSGQFSRGQLEELANYLNKRHHLNPENIIIVDLREEGHGFINGDAVTFFYGPLTVQRGKTSEEVIASDQLYLNLIKNHPYSIVNVITKGADRMPLNKLSKLIAVKSAYGEQELTTELGIRYVRLPVTDHFHPDNNDVEQFIKLYATLKDNDWLHFKCRGGKGRTTTFMAMYDMIKNPGVSLNDIIKRQTLIHGIDLFKISGTGKKAWKHQLGVERVNFLKHFYEFIHAKDGYGKLKWGDWLAIHYPGILDENYKTYVD